jgi:Uma2 family endonuclease
MAEPVRKMPALGRPETGFPADDPFRYGTRWQRVRLPSGEVTEQPIPLTPEDLLDPELGDEVTQSGPHFNFLLLLANLLRGHYESRDDVLVAGDMKILWGIPGLANPAPDIAVIPGVRLKDDPSRGSFDVAKERARPCLIIEVVSALDSEVRRNDYEKKVEIYRRAGLPEYLILDPPTAATKGLLLLTGYRLAKDGRYRRIEPDPEGRLLSETTGLRFGVEEDGKTLLILNAEGERLAHPAEERARAAEAEVARLRAELERLRKPTG